MNGTRTVTVLFTDLVGSTALSARLDPASDDRLRETHFTLLRTEVEAAAGTVVKNLGDGLMVVFDSARAALSCAVGMQQAVERHNRSAEEPLAIRVGVATGEATSTDGDYFGDPVVISARLCALADGGQILATDVVRVVAGRHPGAEVVDIGAVALKGITAPVPCVEVRWEPTIDTPVDIPLPARLHAGSVAPFVGRVEELETLGDALKAAGGDGRRRVVVVGGEPGIGKTSLAAVFSRIAHDEGCPVLYGRCDEEPGVPYQPWAEALSHLVEHSPPGLLDEVLAAHRGDLAHLGPAFAAPGFGGSGARDPEMARYLLFAAVVRLLQAAGRDRPVAIVLDDLQWFDLPSLQLLRHLVSAEQAMAVLIVGTFRESEVATGPALGDLLAWLHGQPAVSRLRLRGLDRAHLQELLEVTGSWAQDGSGAALRDALERETDGNPFFVGELLRHLAETGLLALDAAGRWAVGGDLREEGLPVSVREVVARRTARLGDEAVRILSVAAVIGRDFDLDVLCASAERDDEEVLAVLEAAIAATLVVNVAGEGFSFAHALVGHALYEALPPARRVRTHRRVAQAIEEIGGTDAARRSTELAYHYLQVCRAQPGPTDAAKAIDYACMAGEQALVRLAPAEAERWYREALALLDRLPDDDPLIRSALLVGIGDAQRQTGDRSYRETLLAAGRLAQQVGANETLVAAALANNRGGIFSAVGQVDVERLALIEAAIDAVGETDPARRARLLSLLANERITSLDYAGRRALVDEAIAAARQSADPATLLDVLLRSHQAIRVAESLTDRLAMTAEAEELALRLHDPIGQFWATYQRTFAALEAGDLDGAARCHDEAFTIAARVGQPTMRWLAGLNETQLVTLGGDSAAAEASSQEAYEWGEASGQPDALVLHQFQLHIIRWHQGRGREVVEIIEGLDENVSLPLFHAARARLYFDVGRRAEAEELLAAEAASGFPHLGDLSTLAAMSNWAEVAAGVGDGVAVELLIERLRPWSGQVICTLTHVAGAVAHYLGILCAANGDYAAADTHFTSALETHERLGAPFHLARTHLEWGRMLLERLGPGDVDAAVAHLERAREIARDGGCAHSLARAEELLREATAV